MFSNNGYSLADIAAATGNRNDGGNLFGGGDSGAWILVLFILILAGGWNNGYGNGGGGASAYNITSDVQRGFDQSAVINSLNGINNSINNGFANAEVSRCNSQANILQTLNNIAMNQQSCCCENRAGIADLKYTISTENCADRASISDALKEVLISNTANTQLILDKLCQQEIEALKAQNQQLQMQNYLSNFASSQNAQTSQILADNANQTAAIIRNLNPTAIPAYLVANPNGCNCNNNCGCNNNGFYN